MKKYMMLGGGLIEAASVSALVSQLRRQSQTNSNSDEAFMERTAALCKVQTGAIISTYTKEEFITDLIANGFLTEQ